MEPEAQAQSKARAIRYYEKYMFFIGILGQLLFYVQGIKIFINHSAKDVSMTGFLFALVAVSSWFVYGLLIKNKVLIWSNLIAVIGALFVIIGILIHG